MDVSAVYNEEDVCKEDTLCAVSESEADDLEAAGQEIVFDETVIYGTDYSRIIEQATINEIKRYKDKVEEFKDKNSWGIFAASALSEESKALANEAKQLRPQIMEVKEGVRFKTRKSYIKIRCKVSKLPIVRLETEEACRVIISRERLNKQYFPCIYDSVAYETNHGIVVEDEEFDEDGCAYIISVFGKSNRRFDIQGIVVAPDIISVKESEVFNLNTTYAKVYCEMTGVPQVHIKTKQPSQVIIIMEEEEEKYCLYDSIGFMNEHYTVLEDERLYIGKHKYQVMIISDSMESNDLYGMLMTPHVMDIEEGKEFEFIKDYIELKYELRGGFHITVNTEIPTHMVIMKEQSCIYRTQKGLTEHSIELKYPEFSGKNRYSIRIYSEIVDSFEGKGIVTSNIDKAVHALGGVWVRDRDCAIPYNIDETKVFASLDEGERIDRILFVPAQDVYLLYDYIDNVRKEVENGKYDSNGVNKGGMIGSIILTILPLVKPIQGLLAGLSVPIAVIGLALAIGPFAIDYLMTVSDEEYMKVLEKCLKGIKEKAEFYEGFGYKYGVSISCKLNGTNEYLALDNMVDKVPYYSWDVVIDRWDSNIMIGPKAYYGSWELKELISKDENYFEKNLEAQLSKL